MSEIIDKNQTGQSAPSSDTPTSSLSPFKTLSSLTVNVEDGSSLEPTYSLSALPEPQQATKPFTRRNAIIATAPHDDANHSIDNSNTKTNSFAFLNQNTTPISFGLFDFPPPPTSPSSMPMPVDRANDNRVCHHTDTDLWCDRCALSLSTSTATTTNTTNTTITAVPRSVPGFTPTTGKTERIRRSWQYNNRIAGGSGGYHPYNNNKREQHHQYHQHQVDGAGATGKRTSSSSSSSATGLNKRQGNDSL